MIVPLGLKINSEGGEFKIEIATVHHDLTKIASVINAAYKKVKYLIEETQRISIDELRSIVANPHKRLYLCLSPSREICGTLLLDFIDRDTAEIGLFSIHPAYQGQKIGPGFMSYVEREAFEKVGEIMLKVIPLYQEQLVKFYERLGYEDTGRRAPFPEEEKTKYIRPECRDRVFFSLMSKKKLRSSL